ncbi:MAG: PadR family transcriptional regulator [Bacteroidota bacterium]
MKGTHLGELEELVMLVTAALYDEAYGVAIMDALCERTGRKLSISSVHAVLKRLEEKGFLGSRYDGATGERGGRRKRLFRITSQGEAALRQARELRNGIWDTIPKLAFGQN